ncbi:MAG TPA: hypothetical protein ENI23_14295 [bacterium]|nr:hypothetical protein [bacterium]
MIDKGSGNLILWPALDALHSQVINTIGIKNPVTGAVLTSVKVILLLNSVSDNEFLATTSGQENIFKLQSLFPVYEFEKTRAM